MEKTSSRQRRTAATHRLPADSWVRAILLVAARRNPVPLSEMRLQLGDPSCLDQGFKDASFRDTSHTAQAKVELQAPELVFRLWRKIVARLDLPCGGHLKEHGATGRSGNPFQVFLYSYILYTTARNCTKGNDMNELIRLAEIVVRGTAAEVALQNRLGGSLRKRDAFRRAILRCATAEERRIADFAASIAAATFASSARLWPGTGRAQLENP